MSHHGDRISTDDTHETLEAWRFVQTDAGRHHPIVTDDATNERELLEGLRVRRQGRPRCARSCPSRPTRNCRGSSTCAAPTRLIGGPNPDGRYLLAMIRGDRTYRVTGTRGTTAYLGFQVLAGTGHDPAPDGRLRQRHRPQAGLGGTFALVFSAAEPPAADLGGAQWVPIPDGRVVDRGARVHRRRRDRKAAAVAHRAPRPRIRRSRSPTPKRPSSSPRWRGRSSSSPRCTAPSSPNCSTSPTRW